MKKKYQVSIQLGTTTLWKWEHKMLVKCHYILLVGLNISFRFVIHQFDFCSRYFRLKEIMMVPCLCSDKCFPLRCYSKLSIFHTIQPIWWRSRIDMLHKIVKLKTCIIRTRISTFVLNFIQFDRQCTWLW